MTRIAIVVALVLGALPARAIDRWTAADTAWEATTVALLAADWAQTREIAHRGHAAPGGAPTYCTESNPVLGRYPSQRQANLYFASAIVTHAAVAAVLPRGWRRAWQASTIGVEGYMVGRNWRLGVGMRF